MSFSVKETAAMLGISTRSVLRLIAKGKLRCLTALRTKLIPVEEIRRFLGTTSNQEGVYGSH
jgi:excisionase family DNA binding protein